MACQGKGKEKPDGKPDDRRGMEAMLARFLEALTVGNYSPRTIQKRRCYARAFIAWCEERDLRAPSQVTKPILERYQRWLYHKRNDAGRGLSLVAQRNYLEALRAWFKWLARRNHILYNPASELELPKLGKRLPRQVLTTQEVDSILNQTDVKTGLGVRDRAILETFYSTGIRCSELINLQLYDVSRERGVVTIREGSSSKARFASATACARSLGAVGRAVPVSKW